MTIFGEETHTCHHHTFFYLTSLLKVSAAALSIYCFDYYITHSADCCIPLLNYEISASVFLLLWTLQFYHIYGFALDNCVWFCNQHSSFTRLSTILMRSTHRSRPFYLGLVSRPGILDPFSLLRSRQVVFISL